jgi:probable phosphoglycerate mutase
MTQIYLIRHGETAWSLSGQHTSLTDISLTQEGRIQAQRLSERLKAIPFNAIYVSPLKRAFETCAIAGYASRAIVEPCLVECNYGAYEGITSKEIHKHKPGWNLFIDGSPGGESCDAIQQRAQTIIEIMQKIPGPIALFSHGHFLRAIAICYLDLPIATARHLLLSPASLSLLSQENESRIISLWNDISHLR